VRDRQEPAGRGRIALERADCNRRIGDGGRLLISSHGCDEGALVGEAEPRIRACTAGWADRVITAVGFTRPAPVGA
jgi:hypothetical protein